MLKEILIKAREHPLQAFTWTVLTLCVGYLGHREVTFPDTADSFEKSRLELSVAQMEYDRVGKILAIYHETDQNIQVLIKRADDLVNQKFPEITASDIQDVRALQVQARQEFTKF